MPLGEKGDARSALPDLCDQSILKESAVVWWINARVWMCGDVGWRSLHASICMYLHVSNDKRNAGQLQWLILTHLMIQYHSGLPMPNRAHNGQNQ